jgi:hypothetical protein
MTAAISSLTDVLESSAQFNNDAGNGTGVVRDASWGDICWIMKTSVPVREAKKRPSVQALRCSQFLKAASRKALRPISMADNRGRHE